MEFGEEETQYFSHDFVWENLRDQIEKDPSLQYHLLPFQPPPSSDPNGDERDASAWIKFHNRHSTGRFFKERKYLVKEFPDLVRTVDSCKILEVGCGNGSSVLPILRAGRNIMEYACDCSTSALQIARDIVDSADGICSSNKFYAFHCDVSIDGFPSWLMCDSCRGILCRSTQTASGNSLHSREFIIQDRFPSRVMEDTQAGQSVRLQEPGCCTGGMDFVTLIFTLSSVPLQQMPFVISECFSVLKPGGLLLFRDYGLYDMTMLRFLPNQRIGDRAYVRADGTLSYFFSLEHVKNLLTSAGFLVVELEYCCVKLLNRRRNKNMYRVWVHGKFQKPKTCLDL